MDYTINNKRYSINLNELQFEYNKVISYSDQQFLDNLVEITHLACVIAFYKKLDAIDTISDEGIIHQLIHLMHIPNEPLIVLSDIRFLFNQKLKI